MPDSPQTEHINAENKSAENEPSAVEHSQHELMALEAARLLFCKPCRFMLGVKSMAHLPAANRPEIAFAGRSNVGKSSLTNALTGQKTLARTSNTPGRTREVNFFSLDDLLYLVDMPGYGYAKVSKTEVESWTRLIQDYLRGRPTLARVFVLIDSRHGIKDNDRLIMSLMDQAAVSYQIVLTKADKPKSGAVAKIVAQTEQELAKRPAAFPQILVTSARKNIGLAETRLAVFQAAGLDINL